MTFQLFMGVFTMLKEIFREAVDAYYYYTGPPAPKPDKFETKKPEK